MFHVEQLANNYFLKKLWKVIFTHLFWFPEKFVSKPMC